MYIASVRVRLVLGLVLTCLVVWQEAIKILCRQFVPLNNVYVYNGVAGCGKTYHL